MTTPGRESPDHGKRSGNPASGRPRAGPVLPRPLRNEFLGFPAPGLQDGESARPRAPRSRRAPGSPELLSALGLRLDQRARGRVVLVCVALAMLLPAIAQACAPGIRSDAAGIRIEGVDGVERVRMEIGYRAAEVGVMRAERPTRYQVVSAPVPADGRLGWRLPGAAEIVSVRVLAASGPACD